jgi:chromosome segregation ATPase
VCAVQLANDLEVESMVRLQELKVVTYYSHIKKLTENHAKVHKDALDHNRCATRDNLAVITSLKAQQNGLEQEHLENTMLIEELTRENEPLVASLQSAKYEVSLLERKLEDRPRDLQYLKSAKARLAKVLTKLSTKREEIELLGQELNQTLSIQTEKPISTAAEPARKVYKHPHIKRLKDKIASADEKTRVTSAEAPLDDAEDIQATIFDGLTTTRNEFVRQLSKTKGMGL